MKTTKVTKYLQKVRIRVLKLAFQTKVVKNDLSMVVSDGHFWTLVQKFKVLFEIGHKFINSGAPKTRTCFYAKNSDIGQDLADTFFHWIQGQE